MNTKERLGALLDSNKLAHAYLFEGDGEEVAFWLATSLFCIHAVANEPCGECSNCRRIKNSNHPDVHVIEPDGQSIKIDQVRKLQKEAAYKGVEGNRQVFIIKKADKLNPQSSNALLKFLEEPSQDTLAILISEKRDVILPTILSRVQCIRMDTQHSLERLVRSTGYTDHKHLVVLGTVIHSLEEFEQIKDVADSWVELIHSTFELEKTQSVLSVQTAWDLTFKEKSERLISIRLIQSYVKALWLAKRSQPNAWDLTKLPRYSWDELILLQQLADDLGRGFYSNQHYLLSLEDFFLKKPAY